MSGAGVEALPWRGPGPGRPEDLPLPPGSLPLRYRGGWRKRWRYLGAYSEEFMICAARVQVGLFAQTFWAVWDRDRGELWERTVARPPGARGEVWTETEERGMIDSAPDTGCTVRIEARHPERGQVRAFLQAGPGRWAESVCPNGEGGFVWTRKRADTPVQCELRLGERHFEFEARGIEDESAGYHAHHTVWSWSAGVGVARDGRSVGWNLVQGVNDPPERSERTIWVDGDPFEPPASSFEGLDAISFPGGERLAFTGEAVRARDEKRFVVRSTYRQPFGTFTGSLPGGIELERGLGVMEHHDAVW